jgi:predicted DNA-binding protein (MmcQ/YjbR family)
MPKPLDTVRKLAAQYPGAERTFILGDHEVFRVRKKVFVWLGDSEKGGTYVSVKLKDTQDAALMLPFVTPSAYGMAKWGWINADFPKGKFAPDLVKAWIAESYRHTAPKKLLRLLEEPGATKPQARRKTASRRSKAKRKSK